MMTHHDLSQLTIIWPRSRVLRTYTAALAKCAKCLGSSSSPLFAEWSAYPLSSNACFFRAAACPRWHLSPMVSPEVSRICFRQHGLPLEGSSLRPRDCIFLVTLHNLDRHIRQFYVVPIHRQEQSFSRLTERAFPIWNFSQPCYNRAFSNCLSHDSPVKG